MVTMAAATPTLISSTWYKPGPVLSGPDLATKDGSWIQNRKTTLWPQAVMSADTNNGPGRLEDPLLFLCERNLCADREQVLPTTECFPNYAVTPVTLKTGLSRQKQTNKRPVGSADIADAGSPFKKLKCFCECC